MMAVFLFFRADSWLVVLVFVFVFESGFGAVYQAGESKEACI